MLLLLPTSFLSAAAISCLALDCPNRYSPLLIPASRQRACPASRPRTTIPIVWHPLQHAATMSQWFLPICASLRLTRDFSSSYSIYKQSARLPPRQRSPPSLGSSFDLSSQIRGLASTLFLLLTLVRLPATRPGERKFRWASIFQW